MTEEIQKALFAMQDLKYRDFNCSLIPGLDKDKAIGVRTPELRKYAKVLAKEPDVHSYISILPHEYYDEMNLHGFIICEIADYDVAVKEIDRFLPHVDNWATCDLLSPKAFKAKKNRDRLIRDIQRWMASDEPFVIRFGIEMLMSHYLDDFFCPEYLNWVSEVRNDHYYVRMMVAWFFATALAKQYDATVPYIEGKRLAEWTHNKAIQKAIESFRVSDDHKVYLRTLKMR